MKRAWIPVVWGSVMAAIVALFLGWRADVLREIERDRSEADALVPKLPACLERQARVEETFEVGVLFHKVVNASTAEEQDQLQTKLWRRVEQVQQRRAAGAR